ncbi:MAG: hypothetical protein U0841_07140 [Chloroflexia bacterium]
MQRDLLLPRRVPGDPEEVAIIIAENNVDRLPRKTLAQQPDHKRRAEIAAVEQRLALTQRPQRRAQIPDVVVNIREMASFIVAPL